LYSGATMGTRVSCLGYSDYTGGGAIVRLWVGFRVADNPDFGYICAAGRGVDFAG
jgi:hypothetical protein